MLSQGAYQISAASYDILQAERDRARVRRRYAGDVAARIEKTGLLEVAGVAICHNAVACHPPTAWRALWPAVADVL
ncbi:hypothetical protein SAMN05446589_1765 [Streptomyces sp. OV198]|jgi:hypothetical protein|nr:hypothetical protein SAMN05446589_1765 [Streptomyces sp. OV198]